MTRKGGHPDDPRGLIHEAYRIEGIGVEDCRSIFFDWALGLAAPDLAAAAARRLIAHHVEGAGMPEDHPMTGLLREATRGMSLPVRRGGRHGRRRD